MAQMNAPARRDNCLTLVRYLAAADVLYGHFTRHLALSAPAAVDVLFRWLAGVPVFFFLTRASISSDVFVKSS